MLRDVGGCTEEGFGTRELEPSRIIFDTNIWRRFADANAGPDLLRVVRRTGHELLVPPTVLYESLVRPNVERKRKQIALLTMPRWRRLMPDAYSESMELLEAIRSHRPEWLRSASARDPFIKLRYDWTRKKGGLWEDARRDPEKVARDLA